MSHSSSIPELYLSISLLLCSCALDLDPQQSLTPPILTLKILCVDLPWHRHVRSNNRPLILTLLGHLPHSEHHMNFHSKSKTVNFAYYFMPVIRYNFKKTYEQI